VWHAPADCPQADAVHVALADALPPRESAELPSVTVSGRVFAQADRDYVLELRFDGDRSGRRSLEATSCQGLAQAAAMLIALVIEPPPVPPDEPGAPPAEDTESPHRTPATDSGAAPAEASLGVSFGPSLVLDAGTMPAPTAGFGAAARVRVAALELAVEAAIFPGTEQALAAGSEERVAFSLWELGLVGCLTFEAELRFGPCAGAAASRMTGSSHGVAREVEEQRWVPALQAGGVARLDLGPLSLRLDVRALWPLQRARWSVSDPDYDHRPAPLSVRAVLGIELALVP
jgi:hypothetical protein